MSKINPLQRHASAFGLAAHQYRQFHATVPDGTTVDELKSPDFWALVKNDLSQYCEIRCVSTDGSFYALVLITYVDAISAIPRVLFAFKEEPISPTAHAQQQQRFYAERRGNLGWCVIDRETNKPLRERLANQSDAIREIEELARAHSK